MSGAQWSAQQLTTLADELDAYHVEVAEHLSPRMVDEIDDALRAFASVVSVLERAMWPDSVQVLSAGGIFRARAGVVEAEGDTPLAAILALSDALDTGRGDAR